MKFYELKKISKKGKSITFKMLNKEDAQLVLGTMAQVAETSPYILRSAEDFRKTLVEDEIKWIENANNNPRGVLIGTFHNEQLIGLLDFGAYKNPKMSHRGNIGISILDGYRNEGIGALMFEALLEIIKDIPDLETLELTVMGDNIAARKLYSKVGFREVGLNPKAFKQPNGKYVDDIKMIKNLI